MTRRLVIIPALAAVLLLPAALLRADEPAKGDKDLDGDWEVVSIVRDGKEQTQAHKPVVTIKGDSLSFKEGNETQKGKIKADPPRRRRRWT